MQFSEAEVRFLIQGPDEKRVETSTGRSWPLREMIDLRTLGCPQSVFFKILEDRARKLGNRFVEFRNSCVRATPQSPTSEWWKSWQATPAATTTLDADLAAAKLF